MSSDITSSCRVSLAQSRGGRCTYTFSGPALSSQVGWWLPALLSWSSERLSDQLRIAQLKEGSTGRNTGCLPPTPALCAPRVAVVPEGLAEGPARCGQLRAGAVRVGSRRREGRETVSEGREAGPAGPQMHLSLRARTGCVVADKPSVIDSAPRRLPLMGGVQCGEGTSSLP